MSLDILPVVSVNSSDGSYGSAEYAELLELPLAGDLPDCGIDKRAAMQSTNAVDERGW